MTHDPREALERICQRANETGGADTMALIDTIHAMHGIAREALTASVPKGDPVAWRYTCQDGSEVLLFERLSDAQKARGYYTGEDGEDEVEGDEATTGPFYWTNETPLYTSPPPPPAAGWDEATNWLEGIANNDGNADQHVARRAVELLKSGQALRREAPASSGSDPLLTINYTNYKGETSVRRIAPKSIRFGSTGWHPEPQWLLLAYDADKQADREFALKDFGSRPDAGGDGVREAVAAWMIAHSYPTGHGDTLDDLLNEFVGHAALKHPDTANESAEESQHG